MSSLKILIVEDEAVIAVGIGEDLHSNGFADNEIAKQPLEALKLAETWLLDIVLMDVSLSAILSGIDSALVLRERLNIPCIFINGNSKLVENSLIKDIVRPYAVLGKPFRIEQLITILKTIEKQIRPKKMNHYLSLLPKSKPSFD